MGRWPLDHCVGNGFRRRLCASRYEIESNEPERSSIPYNIYFAMAENCHVLESITVVFKLVISYLSSLSAVVHQVGRTRNL